MAFKILDDAAVIFLQTIYQDLLHFQNSTCSAVRVARQALIDQPLRSTKFGTQVGVGDFIVPVCYQASRSDREEFAVPAISSDLALPVLSPSLVLVTGNVVGREGTILDLETNLLLNEPSRPKHGIQLVGDAGVGKSALRNLCSLVAGYGNGG